MAEKNADREEFRGANHLRVGSARWHRNIGNQQHLKGERVEELHRRCSGEVYQLILSGSVTMI